MSNKADQTIQILKCPKLRWTKQVVKEGSGLKL